MTLYLLAVDPEPLQRMLARYVAQHCCIGSATQIEQGIAAVTLLRPDAVLFEFATPGEIPWSVAMPALRASGAEIIVLSEWPTFAYEAFCLDAAGFALWPPEAAELQEVLARVERRLHRTR